MKINFKIWVLILAVLLIAAACTKESPDGNVEAEEPAEENEVIPIEEPAEDGPEEEEAVLFRSELTGLPIEGELKDKRPIAVMLDNHIAARPQSGLAEAEIVFEFLAEGNITRYMAIIQAADLNSIGPVRSARPYFIDKALEFDALYVHVGGSMEALSDIAQFKMADIDGMNRGQDTFWRTNHKKIPHNMYTSTEALRAAAARSGYRTEADPDFASFTEEDQNFPEEENLNQIRFEFSRYYRPAFVYDPAEKVYERIVKDSPQLEEFSGQKITAKNLLVLKIPTRVVDEEGRLDIETVGKGSGLYITNGKVLDIEWEKRDRRSRTMYVWKGQELLLNPGNTWIVAVPTNLNIEIND